MRETGVTETAGKVSGWVSRTNKNDETLTFSQFYEGKGPDYSANSSNMNNRPTLTFDANEPLDNPTAIDHLQLQQILREYLLVDISGGTYNIAFEDGMSGYGLYINTASK